MNTGRSPSLLAALLEGAATRILKDKELDYITDLSICQALRDMAKRLHQLDVRQADVPRDTPDSILREAISVALAIGTDWWTGTDGAYSEIMHENILLQRVLADVLPEFATRLYICEQIGPKQTKPRVKVRAVKEPA